jgi:hypothetical protein
MGYRAGYGYQSRDSESKQTKRGGFSLVDFGKDVLIGAVMGGLSSLTFYGAGKAVEAVKGSIRNVRENRRGTSADPYADVKKASVFLKEQGLPRELRKDILESFNVRTIKMDIADDSTYGLRFYGGKANPNGPYLFETFTPEINRANLALPPKWNNMSGIKQWQIKQGTTILRGNAAPQLKFGPQYVGGAKQIWVPNPLENLIE